MTNKNIAYLQATYTAIDPNKKNPNEEEVVNRQEENIVNTGEQENVLNEQDTGSALSGSEEKSKGYEEGIRNDSLTEPEFKDSDDQPEFPGEEGNQ